MFVDKIIETTRYMSRVRPPSSDDGDELPDELEKSPRYLLEVETMRTIEGLPLSEVPPLPFPQIWVEFNGDLVYETPMSMVDNHGRPATSLHFRGVFLCDGSVEDYSTPETRAARNFMFFDSRGPGYGISIMVDEWPKITKFLPRQPALEDPAIRRFEQRLLRAAANILYFLSAENQLFIRVRPEDHARLGKKMNPLPKSHKPYCIVHFQAPCYRYLHQNNGLGTNASPRKHRVRGHFRWLVHQRFKRDESGEIRRTWVSDHVRGWGVLTQAIRVGRIPGSILNYDQFVRLCAGFHGSN